MNQFDLQFHHLGLACRDEKRALRFLEGLNYKIGELIVDPLQNVNLRLCHSETMPSIEIVLPTDSPGPLDKMLVTSDSLIYHSCFATSDSQLSVLNMRSDGNRVVCVAEPKPAVLFDGNLVSFYLVRGYGLIELLEIE